ncbi:MAG TPA: 50S ribosomal protein L3 [Chthoniobacterales bacterium]|nr:50S ribosomal protein L3 [Chthoniobacterales bacterium]
MKIGLLGRKIGMTRVYEANGKATPVTVIEAGDNTIIQVKTEEKDGYNAVQVGFDTQKESRVTKPMLGHFKKANVAPKKFVKEFQTSAGAPVDATTKIGMDQFQPGEFVDVIGRSKGKGFQGVVKKHGFAGQPAAHGSKMHRRNGAIGNRSTPGRVWRNMGMPGHLGDDRVTVQNLRIVQVRPEENVILVCGAVPGSNGSYVVLRPAKKKQYPNGGKAE